MRSKLPYPSRPDKDLTTIKSNQRVTDHKRYLKAHTQNAGQPTWWETAETDLEAWAKPIQEDRPVTIEEMKMRESQIHVDLVQDMVPFWIRSVEAAERGEVLRLEQFLEEIAQRQASGSWSLGDHERRHGNSSGGWSNLDGWDTAGPALLQGKDSRKDSDWRWPDDTNNVMSARDMKKKRETAKKGGSRGENCNDGFQFVEKVANSQAAGEERKQQMHNFFEMPTDEKVRKIDEVIRCLRSISY